MSLPVSETFVSIQGEGKLVGTPSWFVRLSGCNLRCAWCDTPYASWNPEGDTRAIEALVESARNSGVGHAVVTGGEPMIFERVGALTEALRDAGLHVTIETAGTVVREAPCDLMSLSPKLANSAPPAGDPRDPDGVWRVRHESRRLNPEAVTTLLGAARDRQLKFVVTGPADLGEIESLLALYRGWDPSDVFLMPEGVTVPEPASVRWIVDACTERGWRYGPRLHIELFGDTRGT